MDFKGNNESVILHCGLITFPVKNIKKITTTTLYFSEKKKRGGYCNIGEGKKFSCLCTTKPCLLFSACNSREQITAVVFYYFNYFL